MQILLATTNPGKVREIRRILPEVDWKGLEDLPGPLPAVRETGETFEENALLKARHYHLLTGLDVVAEDSGLCVDAMDGRPGVRSARYGGEISDADRCRKLLEELEGVPEPERTARFVSCAVLLRRDREPVTVRGEVEGRIAREIRGTGGFGYDPVFLVESYGRTLGEVRPEEKDAVSHRRRSFEALREHLVD